MASMKLRISGGKAAIFSACAPHSGYDYPRRQEFFHELGAFVTSCSAHGPKLLFGDMNARLHKNFEGEEQIVGAHIFCHSQDDCKEDANRHLLVEMCTQLHMCLANTFFDTPTEQLATNRNVGCHAGHPIGAQTRSQIDFMVCGQEWRRNISWVSTQPDMPLSSHHFLLEAEVHMAVAVTKTEAPRSRPDLNALADHAIKTHFNSCLEEALESYEEAEPNSEDVNLAWSRLVDGFHHASENTLPTVAKPPRRPWISSGTMGAH